MPEPDRTWLTDLRKGQYTREEALDRMDDLHARLQQLPSVSAWPDQVDMGGGGRLVGHHVPRLVENPVTLRLVEFWKARLDEDEQVALTAANDKPEKYGMRDFGGGDYDAPGRGEVYAPDASGPDSTGFTDYHYLTCDSEDLSPAVEIEQATHIVRHDPARALREVAVKRRLIDDFADQSCLKCLSMSGWDILSDNMLRALASAYSDHPD